MTQSQSLGTSGRFSVATFLNPNRLSIVRSTERHGGSLILFASLKLVRYPRSHAPTSSLNLLCRSSHSLRLSDGNDPPSLRYDAAGSGTGVSIGAASALSVISLRRNGISTTSAIPTARLPAPSSAKSFAYPGLVATAVVPVGSGIVPEKSPANSDARPVTSIQLPIMIP